MSQIISTISFKLCKSVLVSTITCLRFLKFLLSVCGIGPKYTELMKEGGWVQHQGTLQRIDMQMLARYQQDSSSSVRDDITIPGFQEYSNTDDTVYYSTPQIVAAAQGVVSSSNNEEAPMEERTRKQIEENILFVNKPSQLNCVPSRTSTESLATQLRGVHRAAKPCHRLDRDTSGLVVFGLTKAAHRAISMQFEARTTSKTYLALLSGRPPHDQGSVQLPIGKQSTAAGYNRWTIGGDKPREAITQWTVETVYTDPDTGAVITRIHLTPLTGRGHQLRLHMHALGCPILGDTLHGTGGVAMCSPRLCLHAQQLCVDWNGIRLEADSVPPF